MTRMDTDVTSSDSSSQHGIARVVFTALAAVLLVCAILGVSFSLLLTPYPTKLATQLFSEEEGTGLTHDECAQVGQGVLAFCMGDDDVNLPWGAAETPTTLGEQSRTHLLSVRAFFFGMIEFAAVSSCCLAAVLVLVRRRFGRRAVGCALLAGGIGAVSLAAVFTAIALVDFYDLFNWLHGWFFSSGTWLFPGDALLIRSLPEPLWMFLGALLVIFIAAFSVGCIVGGRRLRRTQASISE